MKRISTKRALLFSLLSLILCVALLVGGSYAWFSDTVTSGNNQIIAGSLDVKLEYSKDGSSWSDVEGATNLFSDVTLWEPGSTSYVYLKLTNAGSLALKYNVSVNATGEDYKNAAGTKVNLKDALVFGEQIDTALTTIADRAAALSFIESNPGFKQYAQSLAAGAVQYITLAVNLPEATGNTYNPQVGQVAKIELGVKVVATQVSSESDTFGNDYDMETPWLGGLDSVSLAANTDATNKKIKIYTAEELAALAQKSGNVYKDYTITLEKDIDLNNLPWSPINLTYMTFDGQGHTVKNLNVSGEFNVGLFGAPSCSTIKNITVDGATVSGINHVAALAGDGLCCHFDKCNVKNASIIVSVKDNDNGDKAGAICGYLSAELGASMTNCSVEDTTIKAYRDCGALVGMLNINKSPAGTMTFTGNSAKNVTLINDRTNNYQGYTETSKYNFNAIAGRLANGFTVDSSNTATSVVINVIEAVKAGATPAETNSNVAAAMSAATAGDVIVLPNTTEGVVLSAGVSGTTIKGDGTTKVDATGALSSMDEVTLEGLDISFGSSAYHGFQHSDVVIKDCVINGMITTYDKVVFENCTFNQDHAEYNAWAYGDCSFINCTFNSYGKFVNVYNEASVEFNVLFEGCTFNNLSDTANKAAINVKDGCGATQLAFNVTIKNCTTNGAFPAASSSSTKIVYSSVVMIDDIVNGGTNSKTKVTLDGTVIFSKDVH